MILCNNSIPRDFFYVGQGLAYDLFDRNVVPRTINEHVSHIHHAKILQYSHI